MAGFLGTLSGQVRLDIRPAVAAYAALRAQNARTAYALRGTGDAFVRSGQVMAAGGGVMVYAFAKVVNAAAEFERKMDFFSAVSNTSVKDMQRLSKFTLQLATDTIYSADQIADGFIELGKAGVSARQIIEGIGVAMTNLGAAGDIPLAESGQIITSTIQQFDLAASDAVRVVDLLAGAANASIADITDLGVSLKYVGGVANAAGIGVESTITAISLLAKAGIRGSTAGTSLRQMLVSLGGATGPARDTLKELGIITADGSNKFFDAQGNAKKLSDVFQILQDHTADLTNKERLMALRTIFNNRALAAAAILTREGAKGFKDMNKEMAKTTAADVARERMDNLSGDVEILRGNIHTLMIQAGTPFQETMREWVQNLTGLVKAFGALDPEVQKGIVQFVGMAGAALLVMGALNIVIGTIFKFMAHMLKMSAGLKFLWKLVKIVAVNFKWLAVLIGGPALAAIGAFIAANALVIGIIVAVIAALVLAYFRFESFRNLVNNVASSVVESVKGLLKWFKLLFTDPAKAWDQLRKAAVIAGKVMADFAKIVGKYLLDGLKAIGSAIGDWAEVVVDWFKQLPGRILTIVQSLISSLIGLFTMKNLGTLVGFVLNGLFFLFVTLRLKLLALMFNLVEGIFNIAKTLGPKVGYAIGFMIGLAIRLWFKFMAMMFRLALKLTVGIINFFIKLPGRLASIMTQMSVALLNGLIRMLGWAADNGPKIAAKILEFIITLPAKVAMWLGRVVRKMVEAAPGAFLAAVQMGRDFVDGLIGQIQGLPDTVWNLLQNVIQAFLDMVRAGYDAAKGVGGALWEGFKDGVGISSPSFIERAIWDITGVVQEETKKLARQTMDIQRLGKTMASTHFGVDLDPALNSMNTMLKQQKMMGTMTTTIGTAPSAADKMAAASGKGKPPKGDLSVTVINPEQERAGQSVSKVMRDKKENEDW